MQAVHLRKYGVAATINFDLFEIDGVDFRVDASHASGDTTIMKDEGAEANTTNGFTDEGNGYSIVLTATEMEAARIVLYLIDSATKAWLDRAIVIETYGNASAQHALDLDDAVRGGMTALPNAAADAAGGLAISDAGGLDLDTKLANTNEITVARMGALTDWINGERLDLLLDAIPTTAMRGTDGANTVVPDAAGVAPTVTEITSDIDANSALLAAIASYIDTEIAAIIATIGVAGAGLTDLGGMSTAMKAEVEAEANDALVAFWTSPATLVALFWNEVLSKASYNVGQSGAKMLRELFVLVAAEGAVNGVATTTSVPTNITGYDDNFFVDQVMAGYNGAAQSGQGRVITGYTGSTGVFTFDEGFTTALQNGDDVVIFTPHAHSISSIQSGLALEATAQAIQAKTDNLPSGIPKNTALAAFPLFMVDSADKVTGKTGESVTAQRSIDGAAFGACANAATETGNGVYKIDLEASDLNGDTIVFRFTSAGALARIISVVTQS